MYSCHKKRRVLEGHVRVEKLRDFGMSDRSQLSVRPGDLFSMPIVLRATMRLESPAQMRKRAPQRICCESRTSAGVEPGSRCRPKV
jgi:hypothetical protein